MRYSLQYASPAIMVLTGIIAFLILFFIIRSLKGKKPKIRKIAGLAAIEDAVGRATEMGRPLMFEPGLGGINPVTMATMAILKSIARSAAKYDSRIIVAIYAPEVYALAEEVCRQGYAEAGKPNLFSPDDIRFISQDQFAYASGTVGIMHREKVAANFMFGEFAAESLILAETGQQVGAIQVAGTISFMQLPFFITTCDYTIIGEELFAGSAYLTQEPILLGSLFGQDLAKMLILGMLVVGMIFSSVIGLDGRVRIVARNPVFRTVLGIDDAKQRGYYRAQVNNLSGEIRTRTVQIAVDTLRLEMLSDPTKRQVEQDRLEQKKTEIEERIKTQKKGGLSNGMLPVWENRLDTNRTMRAQLSDSKYLEREIKKLNARIGRATDEIAKRRAELARLLPDTKELEDRLEDKFIKDGTDMRAESDALEREMIGLELGD